MAEIKTEVKTFWVHYSCDKCGDGEMRQTGFSYATCPPEHEHKCMECGNIEMLLDMYPKKVFEKLA